jgi:hypothetical protein
MIGLPRSNSFRRPREHDNLASDLHVARCASIEQVMRNQSTGVAESNASCAPGPSQESAARRGGDAAATTGPSSTVARIGPERGIGIVVPKPAGRHQHQVADVTYVQIERGIVFPAFVLDVLFRKVLGYDSAPQLEWNPRTFPSAYRTAGALSLPT